FVQALAAATGDEEARKRVQAVEPTARKLEGQEKVTGWPKLEELLGAQGRDVVRRAREWLGRPAPAGGAGPPPPPGGPLPPPPPVPAVPPARPAPGPLRHGQGRGRRRRL